VRRRGERVLRWYPRAWRERYRDELLALVEDYRESGRFRFRDRLDLVRAGLQLHRRTKVPSRFSQRGRVAARLVGCAAALVVFGAVTVDATAAPVASSTTHSIVIAGERGAVVAGAGGAAAYVIARRSNNSNK
jgi:anti-sigma factor RsiW